MSHKKKMISPPKCKQCGACCWILNSDGSYSDCKYLIRYIKGDSRAIKTRCMIYQHRLYAITGKNQYCGRRLIHPYNYPNCPYNKEGLKTHPKYLDK